ncbi:minor tail protein [Arthrobacter phage Sonali]|uniref:Minor tail protein n=1 Tax=Arthrobacter phage Sonali TaxID=2510495 RepID=A0A411CQC2_9CAUD|nr:minor tail protein [Arthrobacter phage Sonali]QAY16129.1 minor tail protein [Arthrobacter phage Sonali]
MTLQDYQVQLPDGTIVGAGTSVGLKSIDGLRSLPDQRGGDASRGQQDGELSGMTFLAGRTVTFEFSLLAPPEGLETAIRTVSRNWQNVKDPSSRAIIGGQYLANLATAGSLPTSAVQVQLPGRDSPLFLLGRPARFKVPVDDDYQYGKATITCEWKVPDGVLYDAAVASGSCGLGDPISGLRFPETPPFTFGSSTGGSMVLTNAGDYDAFPLFAINGPVSRPKITLSSTGEFLRLNTTLASGDILLVDMQAKTVTLNGANRNIDVAPGSSFFTLPPGDSTIGFISDDTTAVAGQLNGFALPTYSTI